MLCLKPVASVAVAILMLSSFAVAGAPEQVTWDGGDGNWLDANWNSGQTAESLLLTNSGSDGYKKSGTELLFPNGNHILIDGEVLVNYNLDLDPGGDFHLKQGASMTVSGGAVWQQITESTADNANWIETSWTELDHTNLTLDNGIFRRIGGCDPCEDPDADPGEEFEFGGGALLMGSWRGDDNWTVAPDSVPPQETYTLVKNGGAFENEGQLWFGSWDDMAPNTSVIMEINTGGSLQLAGGLASPGTGDFGDASLVFTNNFVPEATDQAVTLAINFTGSGEITVDQGGILIAQKIQEDPDVWETEPLDGGAWTYEDMWDLGYLQANGNSGAPLDGDFDKNGVVDGADFLLWQANFGLSEGATQIQGDANDDGAVDGQDFLIWQAEFGSSTGVFADFFMTEGDPGDEVYRLVSLVADPDGGQGAGVPEPAAALLLLAAVVAGLARRSRS